MPNPAADPCACLAVVAEMLIAMATGLCPDSVALHPAGYFAGRLFFAGHLVFVVRCFAIALILVIVALILVIVAVILVIAAAMNQPAVPATMHRADRFVAA